MIVSKQLNKSKIRRETAEKGRDEVVRSLLFRDVDTSRVEHKLYL